MVTFTKDGIEYRRNYSRSDIYSDLKYAGADGTTEQINAVLSYVKEHLDASVDEEIFLTLVEEAVSYVAENGPFLRGKDIQSLVDDNEIIARYHLTNDYASYFCIINKGKVDLTLNAIEDSMHRLLDAGATPDDLRTQMGLVSDDDVPDELKEDSIPIDLGYSLPGPILSVSMPWGSSGSSIKTKHPSLS